MLVLRPQGRALLPAAAAVIMALLQVPGAAAQTAPIVYGPNSPALAPTAQPVSPVSPKIPPAASPSTEETTPARAPSA
ncbi:MAG: hypothetical protein HC900_04250, partial [Methylacidiphilales bacterium]|nr:hypothetical protein [Candidatus Methylacidiphilales bacterium]